MSVKSADVGAPVTFIDVVAARLMERAADREAPGRHDDGEGA